MTRKRVRVGPIAAAFLAVAASVAWAAEQKASRVPRPAVNIVKGDKCVEPTDVMRKNHMKFILHQRDDTMHQGIRTSKHSLKGCIDCHADPQTNSVLGKNGFCETCHTYAAVTIDCFGCHTHKKGETPTAGQSSGDLSSLIRATELRPAASGAKP